MRRFPEAVNSAAVCVSYDSAASQLPFGDHILASYRCPSCENWVSMVEDEEPQLLVSSSTIKHIHRILTRWMRHHRLCISISSFLSRMSIKTRDSFNMTMTFTEQQ